MATRIVMVCAGSLGLALSAAAQTALYGVAASGDLVRIDTASGAGVLIASSGFGCNAAAADSQGRILIGGGAGAQADQIITIDPATGQGSVFLNTVGRPIGYGIRGMAVGAGTDLWVVLSMADVGAIDTLARINLSTGVYTVVGPTGRTDLQALAISPAGVLYALGVNLGGVLCTLNPTTGAATLIGGGNFGGDDQALEFLADGTLLACRAGLRTVNPGTGATALIGATGFTDIRGLAAVPASCYANCDGSTVPPVLNVGDFTCFLQRFAAGESYANCDQSTVSPVLNVGDFTCFLQRFAAGCP
jgi:hypothetical protein